MIWAFSQHHEALELVNACSSGDVEILYALLNQQADITLLVNLTSEGGETLLMHTIVGAGKVYSLGRWVKICYYIFPLWCWSMDCCVHNLLIIDYLWAYRATVQDSGSQLSFFFFHFMVEGKGSGDLPIPLTLLWHQWNFKQPQPCCSTPAAVALINASCMELLELSS